MAPTMEDALSTFAAHLQYHCDLGQLPPHLRDCWVQLDADAETMEFLSHASAHGAGLLGSAAKGFLRQFLNVYDANGLVGGCPMHVLGTEQLRRLLGPACGGTVLDVGAGDGDVTARLAPLFEAVHCTETSWPMAWTLRRRGFHCFTQDIAQGPLKGGPASYDAIAILNVLDRCDRPLSLLRSAKNLLKDGGALLIALVLPYDPAVYRGNRADPPSERLPIDAASFEGSLTQLCERVLQPLGFAITALARCPYLSVGDCCQPVFELDDLVVVCRRADPPLLLLPPPLDTP